MKVLIRPKKKIARPRMMITLIRTTPSPGFDKPAEDPPPVVPPKDADLITRTPVAVLRLDDDAPELLPKKMMRKNPRRTTARWISAPHDAARQDKPVITKETKAMKNPLRTTARLVSVPLDADVRDEETKTVKIRQITTARHVRDADARPEEVVMMKKKRTMERHPTMTVWHVRHNTARQDKAATMKEVTRTKLRMMLPPPRLAPSDPRVGRPETLARVRRK